MQTGNCLPQKSKLLAVCAENPQLAGELEMLQQMRLPVEPLVF
jgi:hypothetical protein